MPPRIVITPGEPAGIGPDITIAIAQKKWPVELIVVADPTLLLSRAQQLGLPLTLIDWHPNHTPTLHEPQTLRIYPVHLHVKSKAGELNPANAAYVLNTLETATQLCLDNIAKAIVTGPVHKGVINQSGISFSGHTEYFAKLCNVDHTVMLFVVDQLKVALATTHVPLADVSRTLTKQKLQSTLQILHAGLKEQFHRENPHLFVCGLNPHAGENGYLGREEIAVIQPVLETLRTQHFQITGPLPADTIFTPPYLKKADAILAMYHDQALPLVKYLGFGHAVNVTLGLPFIRTSVDHGTAIDLAGSNNADAGSMIAALSLAISLSV